MYKISGQRLPFRFQALPVISKIKIKIYQLPETFVSNIADETKCHHKSTPNCFYQDLKIKIKAIQFSVLYYNKWLITASNLTERNSVATLRNYRPSTGASS